MHRGGIARVGRRIGEDVQHPEHGVAQHLLLVAEVLVERGPADAGLADDVGHGDGVVGALKEEAVKAFDDRGAGPLDSSIGLTFVGRGVVHVRTS